MEKLPEVEKQSEALTEAEIARGIRLQAASAARAQMKANEVALKKLYVDWLFDKLNLGMYK